MKQISPSMQPLLTPKSTAPENHSPPTIDRPMIKADTARKLRQKTVVHRKVLGSRKAKERFIEGKTVKRKKLGKRQKAKAHKEEINFIEKVEQRNFFYTASSWRGKT